MTNNETLADIVAEMRDTCGDIADHEVADYADRIEAAYARDIGNAAALREACEKVREAFASNLLGAIGECPKDWELEEAKNVEKAVDAALSAPPRNCDRYRTLDEATTAWIECDDVDECGDPVEFDEWLFAKAEGGAEC